MICLLHTLSKSPLLPQISVSEASALLAFEASPDLVLRCQAFQYGCWSSFPRRAPDAEDGSHILGQKLSCVRSIDTKGSQFPDYGSERRPQRTEFLSRQDQGASRSLSFPQPKVTLAPWQADPQVTFNHGAFLENAICSVYHAHLDGLRLGLLSLSALGTLQPLSFLDVPTLLLLPVTVLCAEKGSSMGLRRTDPSATHRIHVVSPASMHAARTVLPPLPFWCGLQFASVTYCLRTSHNRSTNTGTSRRGCLQAISARLCLECRRSVSGRVRRRPQLPSIHSRAAPGLLGKPSFAT